jgi:hypothetical protein
MSLAVAAGMQGRLLAAPGLAVLDAWAAANEQGRPRVELGYRKPAAAQDWPYVALVPAQDERDLRTGRPGPVSVAVAVGVRLAGAERGEALGLLAVDALAEAVLGALASPARYAMPGGTVVVERARRVDAEYRHPQYELELLVELGPTI